MAAPSTDRKFTDGSFDFSLSTTEHAMLRKAILHDTIGSSRSAIWLIAIWVVQLFIQSFNPQHSLFKTIFVCASVFAIGMNLLQLYRNRLPKLATDGSLQLSDAGFFGTLDGTPAAIEWADIETVRDADEWIVVLRRRGAGAIAIPKTCIADVPGLWATLEDRLVSKRGLIRSVPPRKLISNSAY